MSLARNLVVAACLAGVAALTSCGGDEPPGPPALSAADAEAEYRTEAATLTLAPGWSWPEEPVQATASDGLAMVYEPGYGKQAADYHWFCSWSDRTLDGTLPKAQRDKAAKQLPGIRRLYYYTDALPVESRPFIDEVLRSVALGDLARLQNDFRLNCPTRAGS